MSLAEQPLQIRNSCLIFVHIAIAAERFFGIFSQFISLPRWKTGMNPVLAGDLSRRLAAFKLSYYRYLEISVVASPCFFHLHPSKDLFA